MIKNKTNTAKLFRLGLATTLFALTACQSMYDDAKKDQCDHMDTRNLPHCAGHHQPELPPNP